MISRNPKYQFRIRRKKTKWYKVGLIILILLLIGVGLFFSIMYIWNNFHKKQDSLKTRGKQIDPITAKVEKKLKEMSIEEKVGQMLMVGFSGKEPDYYIKRMIELRHIGGVILFSENIDNPQQLLNLNNSLQNLAMSQSPKIPLFIAIDQEGGEVVRISEGVTVFPDAYLIGQTENSNYAYIAARDTAEELVAMGVNVNLAPVLDISSDFSIMKKRSFGSNPRLVADMGAKTIEAYQSHGLMACAKHFPGIGQATIDPHNQGSTIEISRDRMEENELFPFKEAITSNVYIIMISHLKYSSLNPDLPATLSYEVQTNLLRKELGFGGIIITDSMQMGAIVKNYSLADACIKAVFAGSDIILVPDEPEKQKEVYEKILDVAKKGELSQSRIDDSVRRILNAKMRNNFWEKINMPVEKIDEKVGTDSHKNDLKTIEKALGL